MPKWNGRSGLVMLIAVCILITCSGIHAAESKSIKTAASFDPTYLWHTFYGGGTTFEYGQGIAVDSGGNVYVAGWSDSSWTGPSGQNPLHAHSGGNDLFILKLNGGGVYQWHTFYGSNGDDKANGIAVDTGGNVYVVGEGNEWAGPSGQLPLNNHGDGFAIKLNSSGAYQWHTFFVGTPNGVAADGNGNIYITGESHLDWEGPAGEAPLHSYSGYSDIFALKLGSDGAYKWHTFYGSPFDDYSYAISLDGNGNVYATGISSSSWQGRGNAAPLHAYSEGLNGSLTWDIFVLKLNGSGAYQWHTFYGGSYDDLGASVVADTNGNVYVAGYTGNFSGLNEGAGPVAWNGPSGQSPLHAYNGDHDIVVLKLNSSGEYQWHTFYGSDSFDRAFGISADNSGNIYLTGGSDAGWSGPSGESPLHEYNELRNIYILALNGGGAYQWHTFHGSSDAFAIAADNSGNLYASGYSAYAWDGPSGQSPLHAHDNLNNNIFTLKMNASAAKCVYAISPSDGASFSSASGTGVFQISTGNDCPWTATTDSTWITVTSGGSGSGSGTVSYSVAANTARDSRSGAITIAGQALNITQESRMQYTLTVSSSGSGTVKSSDSKINCGATCSATYEKGNNAALSASPASGYIFSGWSGDVCSGNGICPFIINFDATVAATFTKAPCTYVIDSSGAVFNSAAGSESVKVSTQSGCKWTAAESLSWVTVTSGSSGTGSGVVKYSVAANTAVSSRTGSLSIAGNTFTIKQNASNGGPEGYKFCSKENKRCKFTGTKKVAFGANGKFVYKNFTNSVNCTKAIFGDPSPKDSKACYTKIEGCVYSFKPVGKTIISNIYSGSIAVTASQDSCKWTSKSNVSWLSVTSGSSRTGSGTVGFSAAANTGAGSRTGVLTIAGQAVSIVQKGSINQYTLTVSKAGSGSGTITSPDNLINCGATCSAAYDVGASAILTASPNSGSVFSGWSGGICSGTSVCSVAMNAAAGIAATFIPCSYSLSPASGTIKSSGGSGSVSVTAAGTCPWSAASGAAWITIISGDSGTGNGVVGYAVTANAGINARTGTISIGGQTHTVTQAGIAQYNLTVTKTGSGNGTVTSVPSGINCGSACSAAFNSGTSVVLTAVPDSGRYFAGWTGGCLGTGICSVTLNSEIAVNAAFQSCGFSISPTSGAFNSSGGSGSVSVLAAAGTCGWTAISAVPWITITSGGSGSGNGTAGYTVAANTDVTQRTGTISIGGQSLTITQAGLQKYALTINKTGEGGGTVTSAPSGINCGSTCTATFTTGASVVLTAAPDSGSVFGGWSGGCSGTGTCSVSMSSDTAVTVAFVPCTFNIAPAANQFTYSGGSGSVSVTTAGACGWTAGSNVSWITITSGNSGTGNGTVSYTVAENTAPDQRTGSVTIAGQVFTITQTGASQGSLNIIKTGSGNGVITSSDNKINCGATCTAAFKLGTTVTLTATADTGITFEGWSGGGCTGKGVCTITVTTNTTLTAGFTSPITLTIDTPLVGAVINNKSTLVSGTLLNPTGTETGVTVNGIPAIVMNNQFIVNNVSLAEGANTITVKAVDTQGVAAKATVDVQAVTPAHYLRFTATPESGVAPLEVTLRLSGTFTIQESTLSYSGPALPEVLSSAVDEYKLRMTAEGLYTFAIQSTGPDGNTYEATIVVQVLNKEQLDTLLKAKWEGMKTALVAGDTETASNYFANSTKVEYKKIFDVLTSRLPQIVQDMQTINLIYITDATAQYRIRRQEGSAMITYYVYFIVDEDGIWKIRSF